MMCILMLQEMIKNKLYGTSADIFSYGVMLYRMLCGSKPFKGKVDRDLDKAVVEKKPVFPKEIFSKEATSLLTGVSQFRAVVVDSCCFAHAVRCVVYALSCCKRSLNNAWAVVPRA